MNGQPFRGGGEGPESFQNEAHLGQFNDACQKLGKIKNVEWRHVVFARSRRLRAPRCWYGPERRYTTT